MIIRLIFIFLSIIGIGSTFMPWLYYPKANAVLYGYLSDGIITGFLYLLILIFAIYTYRKKILISICP